MWDAFLSLGLFPPPFQVGWVDARLGLGVVQQVFSRVIGVDTDGALLLQRKHQRPHWQANWHAAVNTRRHQQRLQGPFCGGGGGAVVGGAGAARQGRERALPRTIL